MLKLISGLLGASVLALTVACGPLAAGALSSSYSGEVSVSAGPPGVINRIAKGDRRTAASLISGKPALIVQVESLEQTSVAIKPEALPGKDLPGKDLPRKESNFVRGEQVKRAVACEPVVSVLTEVARMLEPGRCVT